MERVFLSSTLEDLKEYREKAAEAIQRLGLHCVRMEAFCGDSCSALRRCFDEIDNSDALVGIYAHCYGHIPKGEELSFTELEFNYARSSGKKCLCFIVEESVRWIPAHIDDKPTKTKLNVFKGRISEGVVRENFTTSDDLALKITTALVRCFWTPEVGESRSRVSKAYRGSEKETQAALSDQGCSSPVHFADSTSVGSRLFKPRRRRFKAL